MEWFLSLEWPFLGHGSAYWWCCTSFFCLLLSWDLLFSSLASSFSILFVSNLIHPAHSPPCFPLAASSRSRCWDSARITIPWWSPLGLMRLQKMVVDWNLQMLSHRCCSPGFSFCPLHQGAKTGKIRRSLFYINVTNLKYSQQPIHNYWLHLETYNPSVGDKLCHQPLGWGDSRSAGWQSQNQLTLIGKELFLGANDKNALYCCKFGSTLQGYYLRV